MMHHAPAKARVASRRRTRRGFTLTELLVAMGIIAIIGGITAIGIRTVAQDAKLSSATNTVTAALNNARSLAIRENTLVALVFRAGVDDADNHYVEVITARWTGESPTINVGGNVRRGIDRFEPVPGVARRRLPSGIQVAGPLYHSGTDDRWATQTSGPLLLGNGLEEPHRVIGVMFTSDGSVVSRNSGSDAWRMFVDFNNDGIQQISGCTTCQNGELDYGNPPNVIPNNGPDFQFNVAMMLQAEVNDEPYITMVPFLAVYDDVEMRTMYDMSAWANDWEQQRDDLSDYINEYANRLHFNRYTGVVMR